MVRIKALMVVVMGLLLPAVAARAAEPAPVVETQVAALLRAEQFDRIDALAAEFRTSQSRSLEYGGLWNLSLFNDGISEAIAYRKANGPQFWKRTETLLQRWIAHAPTSPSARLAYAQMLSAHGWNFRGNGYAATVAPQHWKPFRDYIAQSRAYLEKYKTVAAEDPRWYEQMADIATVQSWPQAQFDALMEEGLDRHPLFYPLYFAAVRYYAPKWGGSGAAIEGFARMAYQRTYQVDGFGMYARIYWVASQTQYGDELFSESKVSWPTMSRGIDDVLAKYPDSWNVNNFARFACLAGDQIKTKALIAQIKGPPLMDAWRDEHMFEYCKAWSAATLPPSDHSL